MIWQESDPFDPRGRWLADRHYSRQNIGAPRFVPPGRCAVFVTPVGDAVWATLWQKPEYTKHQWAGAWNCSIFRNEGPYKATQLILDAVGDTQGKLLVLQLLPQDMPESKPALARYV